jgi:hypothetical protein
MERDLTTNYTSEDESEEDDPRFAAADRKALLTSSGRLTAEALVPASGNGPPSNEPLGPRGTASISTSRGGGGKTPDTALLIKQLTKNPRYAVCVCGGACAVVRVRVVKTQRARRSGAECAASSFHLRSCRSSRGSAEARAASS